MKPQIKIAWLFPHVFSLHGDRGNLLALEHECRRRGYLPVVEVISLDTKVFDPLDYDLILCPPGEIKDFKAVIDYLRPHQEAFATFIKERPLLVTGTSISLFATSIKRFDGDLIKGLDLIKVDSVENDLVYGDDLYYHCSYNQVEMKIFGSQIQMAQVNLIDEKPFGVLEYGYGNTGETRGEGIKKEKAIFTNTLGPILVCNPWLTIELINVVEKYKKLKVFDQKRNNDLEIKSLKAKSAFIMTKKSELLPIDQRRKQ